jgi:ATP phosphoribosyltransferase
MSEAIVDLVATGKTLQENSLVEIEQIFASTARLIANPLSYRLNRDDLQQTIQRIEVAAAAMFSKVE